jgi:hypothetical protein
MCEADLNVAWLALRHITIEESMTLMLCIARGARIDCKGIALMTISGTANSTYQVKVRCSRLSWIYAISQTRSHYARYDAYRSKSREFGDMTPIAKGNNAT